MTQQKTRKQDERGRASGAPLGTHSLTGSSAAQGMPVAKDGVSPGKPKAAPRPPAPAGRRTG